MPYINDNINIEGARIGFRNFAGKEGKFNLAGNRNFCVFLETELAKVLQNDGWNVRWLQPRDETEEPQASLQVTVSFNNRPPKIVLITGKEERQKQTALDEDTIAILDWAEIENVDLIIRPYNWAVSGKEGVKAYIKSMYVTLAEDKFESKYYDVPDSVDNSMCNGCLNISGACDQCPKHNGN